MTYEIEVGVCWEDGSWDRKHVLTNAPDVATAEENACRIAHDWAEAVARKYRFIHLFIVSCRVLPE